MGPSTAPSKSASPATAWSIRLKAFAAAVQARWLRPIFAAPRGSERLCRDPRILRSQREKRSCR